jgi:MoxR-like ATPase
MTTATAPATSLQQTFSAIVSELNNELYEREDVIRATMLALLSEQHIFLFGVPGTAKSEIARRITTRIAGARKYEYLLTKTTTADDLFGALDVAKEDHSNGTSKTRYRVERDITGSMADSEIVFADEIFKASSPILNAMLALLNERVFHTGNKTIKTPLRTMISASNEVPEDSALAALYDRLALRVNVAPITSDSNFMAMLAGQCEPTANPTVITMADLDQAIAEVRQIATPHALLQSMARLRREVQDAGLCVSDRKWRQILRIVQAHAWLRGSGTAEDQDLTVVRWCLWDAPSQIAQAEALAKKFARTLVDMAREAREEAEQLYLEAMPKVTGQNNAEEAKVLLALRKEVNKRLTFVGSKGNAAKENSASEETVKGLRTEYQKIKKIVSEIDRHMKIDETSADF